MAINKKSTIFVQSSWNLVEMINSWVDHFHQVSWGLDKNCRFFINGQFLKVTCFFPQTLLIYWCHITINLHFIFLLKSSWAGLGKVGKAGHWDFNDCGKILNWCLRYRRKKYNLIEWEFYLVSRLIKAWRSKYK